jgi:isochorismate hydrolase
VIIDMQERLLPVIAERETTLENVLRLAQFARIMNIPVVVTEQEKLGDTLSEIHGALGEVRPIRKVEFDSFRSKPFMQKISTLNRRSMILAGVEAHICVAQTALHGANEFCVHVAGDAVSSRRIRDRDIALDRMRQQGVVVSSTEMVIYELMERAGTDTFRDVLKLVK